MYTLSRRTHADDPRAAAAVTHRGRARASTPATPRDVAVDAVARADDVNVGRGMAARAWDGWTCGGTRRRVTTRRWHHTMGTTRATGDDASTTRADDDATEMNDHGFSTDGKNRAYAASMDADASRRRLGDARATYAMTISYDGTNYKGFQRQGADVASVQRELERCLTRLTGEGRDALRLGGSGRTDGGVHARGQVVHFYSEKDWRSAEDFARCVKAMNGMLPRDVRCERFWRPHPAFHSRFHATRKTYAYYVDARSPHDVFARAYACQCGWRACDVDALRRACQYFVGTRDFRAFANTSRDKPTSDEDLNTTRTIFRFDVFEQADGLIRLECEGDGFLYRQVRNMVGAALVVASGREKPEWILDLLASGDRRRVPTAAPARGLFLQSVEYPDSVKPMSFTDVDVM